jgi:hypothetical protein
MGAGLGTEKLGGKVARVEPRMGAPFIGALGGRQGEGVAPVLMAAIEGIGYGCRGKLGGGDGAVASYWRGKGRRSSGAFRCTTVMAEALEHGGGTGKMGDDGGFSKICFHSGDTYSIEGAGVLGW